MELTRRDLLATFSGELAAGFLTFPTHPPTRRSAQKEPKKRFMSR
mgnify:CR=1 FL=1